MGTLNMNGERVILDPADYRGLVALMDKSTEFDCPIFAGTNEHGEDTLIELNPNKVAVITYQDNGWARLNTYYRDGTRDETFMGRWQPKASD